MVPAPVTVPSREGEGHGTFNRGFQRFWKRSLWGPSLPGILVEVQKVGTLGEEEGDAREGACGCQGGFSGPCSCRAGVPGRPLDKAARSRLRHKPTGSSRRWRTSTPSQESQEALPWGTREGGRCREESWKIPLSLSYPGENLAHGGMQ